MTADGDDESNVRTGAIGILAGKRIAIANRAEIAVRIAATCTRLGAVPILVLGEPDIEGYAARQVGRVECVGPAGSELDVDRVIQAARRARAEFLHPGYGFLSERPALSEACEAAGIRFVGPSPATLRLCGDKMATRNLAARAGVPVVAASPPLDDDPAHWLAAAEAVGYPLMVKPAEAGGGRGLRHVADTEGLVAAVRASRREGAASGASGVIFLEREMIESRHVEVQVVADGSRTFALGDRDCSLQRRHQKVVEEAPAPHVSAEARHALHDFACRIAEAAGLRGIATCEFLLDAHEAISFLEVNPRIQVEHPVTELVTGVDLVHWQLLIASGEPIRGSASLSRGGHAIEARIYAEDPDMDFLPVAGKLGAVVWPHDPAIRVDAGYATGDLVPNAYDAMLAKVIAQGPDRATAIAALRAALQETIVAGMATNLGWLQTLLVDVRVQNGRVTTSLASRLPYTAPERGLAPVAAVAHTLDRDSNSDGDPWSVIGPWRAMGRAQIVVHGDGWEENLAVWRDGAGWRAMIAEVPEKVRWWRGPDGILTVAAGDEVARFATIERKDAIDVYGSDGRWTVRLGPRPVRRESAAARRSDGLVRAPLPASVIGVHVRIGDRVAQGAPLVTLSAMKMEIVCGAPRGAVVESIACQVDDVVAANQILVKLVIDAEAPDNE